MFIRENLRKEIAFIRSAVEGSLRLSSSKEECAYLAYHFGYDLPTMRSVRTADQIAANILAPSSEVLDWGCGYGQIAYLLKNRCPDARLVCCDVHDAPAWRVLMDRAGITYVKTHRASALPFEDGTFDYVLAVGVLEHVQDDARSLFELYRVLRPGGRLLLSFAPNKWSYTEFIMKRLGKPSHDRLYSRFELRRLIERAGFSTMSARYEYILPIMLMGFPDPVKRVYDLLGNAVFAVDAIASRVPGLNLLCSNIAVTARRTDREEV